MVDFIEHAGSVDVSIMRFDPQAGIMKLIDDTLGRRRWGRLEQEAVVSDHGPVQDLSAGGMRLICRRPPSNRFQTRIWGLGCQVDVSVQMTWSRRCGFFRYEAGVEFVNQTPEQIRSLTALALNNRLRRVM